MIYKTAKVVGLNTDQQASLITTSFRNEQNLFLAVLSLSCDDAFTRGRQALSEAEDNYFEGEGSSAEKLTATFAKTKENLASCQNFDILLASISGKALYLIGHGQVTGYIQRLDKFSSLLQDEEQLISGFLQEGDRVFLSTQSLALELGEDLKSSVELKREDWEEYMEDRVAIEKQNLAGLILDVEEEGGVSIPRSVTEADQEIASEAPIFQNIKSKLLSVFKKLATTSRKGKLALAAILILVIGLGVGLSYKSNKDREKARLFSQFLEQARGDYNLAQGLQTLNPEEAASKLGLAKENLDKALALKPKDPGALELKKQIEQNTGTISQKFENISFNEYLDLELIKKGFKSEVLNLSVGKLLLLDQSSKTLVVIELAKKSHQILAGKDSLGDAKKASINGNLAFVYSLDKGVLRVDIGSQKTTTLSKVDKDWGDISDIYGFSGNVYLLDTDPSTGSTSSPQAGSGQVWKYIPISEGYSDKREYLTKDTKVDFGGAQRMQIESSIYILKQGGEILRFTRGVKDHFSIGGLDKGIKEVKSIFTSSDTENLYVLDSGNSRLVVLTKTGGYKAQYQGDKFAKALDLVVDEKARKVYLLEGSKIYSVDLK